MTDIGTLAAKQVHKRFKWSRIPKFKAAKRNVHLLEKTTNKYNIYKLIWDRFLDLWLLSCCVQITSWDIRIKKTTLDTDKTKWMKSKQWWKYRIWPVITFARGCQRIWFVVESIYVDDQMVIFSCIKLTIIQIF